MEDKEMKEKTVKIKFYIFGNYDERDEEPEIFMKIHPTKKKAIRYFRKFVEHDYGMTWDELAGSIDEDKGEILREDHAILKDPDGQISRFDVDERELSLTETEARELIENLQKQLRNMSQ
jgi:hypothetical protein